MNTKRSIFLTLIAIICVLGISNKSSAQDNIAIQEERAFQQAIALAEPSIVRIQTIGGLDQVGGQLLNTGPTTGVIVSEDGYILTSSFNFVGQPASTLVTLTDGRRFTAQIICKDDLKSLTLIKIEANKLPVIQITKNSEIEVGQWAIALGRTYDPESPNISIGIVSAKKRVWGKAIQVDAKISPTNYGGPILNVEGKMMGILVPLSPRSADVSAGVEWYDSGIGFAIPAEEAFAKLDSMKKGEILKPGLLGVTFYQNSKLGDDPPKIKQVRVGSPAKNSGLMQNDLILEVDGEKTPTFNSLKTVLTNRYANDTVSIRIQRDKETLNKKAKLVPELTAYEFAFMGVLPERSNSPEPQGVTIRYVFPDSPASKSGLKPGDRITQFNTDSVVDALQLSSLLELQKPDDVIEIKYSRNEKVASTKITLTQKHSKTPDELKVIALEPGINDDEKGPKLGHVNFELKEFNSKYWGIVPDLYNEANEYALVLWLHPSNNTMEAALLKQWKSICNQRNIILLAPKAKEISGWNSSDLEAVTEGIKHMKKEYSIDENRVVAMGYENGGNFTFESYFRERSSFQGVIAISGMPKVPILENSPEFPVQMLLVSGEKSKIHPILEKVYQRLVKMKFPASLISLPNQGESYPSDNQKLIETIGRWVDSLDRL